MNILPKRLQSVSIDDLLESDITSELNKLELSYDDMTKEDLEEILAFLYAFRCSLTEFQQTIDTLIQAPTAT